MPIFFARKPSHFLNCFKNLQKNRIIHFSANIIRPMDSYSAERNFLPTPQDELFSINLRKPCLMCFYLFKNFPFQ